MPQNGQDPSRLDRLEGMIEVILNRHIAFEDDHAHLLKAQAILTDRLDTVTARLDRLAGLVAEIAGAQKHTDERLNALIATVDEIIRKPPRQAS